MKSASRGGCASTGSPARMAGDGRAVLPPRHPFHVVEGFLSVVKWCYEVLLPGGRARVQRLVSIAGFSRTKATSPTVAPPRHVAERLPVGHTARAACTHSSHRTLEMLILAPSLRAVRVNLALPLRPTVVDGDPPHWDVEPDMPSQMASCAAFSSWKMIFL